MKKVVCSLFLAVLTMSAVMANEPKPLTIYFYFTPSCPLCEPAKKIVAQAEENFGARINVQRRNHSESKASFKQMLLMLDHYQRRDTPNLAIFMGEICLGGGEEIRDKLIPTIEKLLTANAVTPDFGVANIAATTNEIAESAVKKTTLPIIIATGFFDGLNPCAFATVILFVSMLSAIKRERKTILAVGVSFIIAVFITYFALGALYFEVMNYFENSPTFNFAALAIKWLALLMVIIAAILSLIDFWRALRSGGKEKMLLVLPDNLKDRIRKRLRATAHGKSLIAGAFFSGIVISFLEAACTGQTYMPVITGLVGDKISATHGYALLLLYNVMFIIPLLAVFLMAFFGMTSEEIGNLARKKAWLTKLALALVFIAIAIWLGGLLLPTIY